MCATQLFLELVATVGATICNKMADRRLGALSEEFLKPHDSLFRPRPWMTMPLTIRKEISLNGRYRDTRNGQQDL
ncbi:hypothetical protein TNCV_3848101 [Trichonephila clavipes]|uniref:Uncharacterized protein n=1 Tax=Trichonephila clavipes TaxID=2585209 RepID=A0A8X6R9Z3_TRICX|nr:hypothetical protein TNCV_3848101 [Trichonephila clavipes]